MNDSSTCDACHRTGRSHGLQPMRIRALAGKLCAVLLMLALAGPAGARAPAVAFHYGADPPLDELAAFDIAVVEPDHVADPRAGRRAGDGGGEFFAYVSFGEVLPSRTYFKAIPAGILKGENRAWGSSVVDQTAPAWPSFFLEHIVGPLWERGYRGFFLDTLDSYQLIAATPAARAAQEAAMVATLRALARRFPGIRLMFNRGFEILPQVSDLAMAVAAESVYRGWDQEKRVFREVPAADRDWLLGQLRIVRERYRLPAIAIDYLPASQRALARTTARALIDQGLVPWVATPELDALGVGSREVLPRRVLVFTDLPEDSGDFHSAPAQRYLGIHLNHLGYTYELRDPRFDPLPAGEMAGRYAGIVLWLTDPRGDVQQKMADLFRRALASGVRIAVFHQFPFALDAAMRQQAGLEEPRAPGAGRIVVAARDPMIGLEREPLPTRRDVTPLRAGPAGRALLRLSDGAGTYDAAAILPWGGYVLAPFSLVNLEGRDQVRWVVNPLAFLSAAFAREALPVPDVTTEAGRRILMVHVDGDGWASRAEMAGTPFASDVMARELLERFRVPTTVSVIEGETSAAGVYGSAAPALEGIARRIFRLPHVEAASHSFSHPFNWRLAADQAASGRPAAPGAVYHLPLAGYRFDPVREIDGSVDYVNRQLVPDGKRAAVFLWTGDCVPPGAVIAAVERAGLLNMNGGDTLITRSQPSWTLIAAQGIRKNGGYQVFAPMQNENVYTNNWTGPFYGYERVIETFELTEAPHRFKPINIYYHTYSASKPAALSALRRVYQYALAQNVTPLYASEYIRKVRDFERMTLARDTASGDLLVRGDGALRTLRLAADGMLPDLAASTGVAGVAPGPSARYLTLDGGRARLRLAAGGPALPYLVDANGRVSSVVRDGDEFGFTLESHVAPTFRLALTERCTVTINGRAARATERKPEGSGMFLQRHDADPTGLARAPHQQVVRVRCLQ
ncbi:MAG: endo alpha-1,4 polygalactosaminidase [Burkholderiales bacterium]|nr:endo alpha-1,4 polygalactosaminidase [Burkholderiales bacterium]